MKRCVLIISTGRTGTKFFADLIKKNTRGACAHHASSYTPLINVLSNAYLAGLFPRKALITTWKILKRREVIGCSEDIYLDSNNHLYALPGIAPELYPNLKIIHLVRDPRTYVASHINWIRHRPKSFIAHHYIPFWQPNGFLTRKVPLTRWIRISTFEKFCWIWAYKNSIMRSFDSTSPDYYFARFEDIFSSPAGNQNLNKLLHFAELPPIVDALNELQIPKNQPKERSFSDWTGWTPNMCATLDKICGKMMHEYGYGAETNWQEMVKIGNKLATNLS